jgi:hypothetical protein
MKRLISNVFQVSFVSVLFLYIFLFAKCRKEEPLPDDYYIRCKVNDEDYWPNKCANCMRGQLLGDTVYLMNANAGYESVSIGIVKLDKIPITTTTYDLTGNPQQNGVYDNSPQVNDIFKTDSIHTGKLTITTLDKVNKIVAGTFHFDAYNPVQNKTVTISNGQFRLKYTDN